MKTLKGEVLDEVK